MMNVDLVLERYLSDLPLLHTWDNGKTWNTGGFQRHHLERIKIIIDERFEGTQLRILETGAGNSTILFSLLRPKRLVTIAHPEDEVIDRIRHYCFQEKIDISFLEYHASQSEIKLPELVLSRELEDIDIVLIDGGHGWPTVFVDFFYCNYVLNRNGLMLIDDIQLYSVKELIRFMHESSEWRLIEKMGKLWAFEKLTDTRYFDHNSAYIMRRTQEEHDRGVRFKL